MILFYVIHTQLCETFVTAEEMLSFSIELDYDDFFVEIKTTKAKKMRASSTFFFNGIQKDALEFSKGHIFSRKWQKCNFNGKKSYLSSTFFV